MADLEAKLREVASAPVLLIASDYDGTLAPIVNDPGEAETNRAVLVALRSLSKLPQTHVAIISGRALADLASRADSEDEIHLVGSHGSEFEMGIAAPLSQIHLELLARLNEALAPILGSGGGFLLEKKPASLAFHYRNAPEPSAAATVDEILRGPATWPGVHVRHGKKVIELSVVATDKGAALERLRQRLGASAVVFLGDDVTDEDAFVRLHGPDVGIKVGAGQSQAAFRVNDVSDVAHVLAKVAEDRAEWLAGASATPIERHSLLSDQRTVALVDPDGRVVWMCAPRIDSQALFAELLGGPVAGFFAVEPAIHSAPRQEYDGDTFVLRTSWPGFTLLDYLDCGAGRAFQRAGRTDLIRVLEGRGPVRITFAPRLDYGRMETTLRLSPHGVEVEGAIDPLVLRASGLPWRIVTEGRHQTAVAEFELSASPLVLELRYGTASLQPDPTPEPIRRQRTERFWSGWAASLQIPSLAKREVVRSALVLKALSYGPSGAIAAAATAGLPEHAGGVRNWDYRYCWPRDAAMAASTLARLGVTGPALRLLDWILGVLDQAQPGSLISPVYTVSGGHLGPEAEIATLAGYRGSRPVRIGNAASQQVQLDVFGPIVGLLDLLAQHGAALSSEHWRLVETMVEAVQRRWTEPDHGIWEVRRPRQQHVHSKVMCWQTLDCAVRIARYLGRERSDWTPIRDAIAAEIMAHGGRDGSAFGATYDNGEADASALAVGLSGLLPWDHPRVIRTVEHVARSLLRGPVVYRYRYDDGLPGEEGAFHVCTSWLIESYARSGRREEAHTLFEAMCALCGPTGLLTEQYEPDTQMALGNFPQAYSHLGLINAALELDRRG